MVVSCYCKFWSLILCSTFFTPHLFGQGRSPFDCLDYPADSKLLIIHADDLGMSHAENRSSIVALEKGCVSSGSIMVPCPWFNEMAAYVTSHPEGDFGIHLTLTSEWKQYKWRPVAPVDEVSSLTDELGYFFDNTLTFVQHAKLDEVEKEVRAQVALAKQAGIDITHLDTHMFSMAANLELAKLYIQLSHAYNIPIPINLDLAQQAYGVDIRSLLNEKDVLLENIFMAEPKDNKNGLAAYYRQVLKSVKPGVSLLLIHPSENTREMQAITAGHPDYGSSWRAEDFDFFSSKKCKKIIRKLNIQLITWREIRDKCYLK